MRKINERWWIGTEVGYGTDGITPMDIGNFEGKNRIFEIKPEVFTVYSSIKIETFCIRRSFLFKSKGKECFRNYYDENDVYYSFSSADYKRTKYGLNINYSILLHKESSWFGFMPKIGFGIRQRKYLILI
jgi:hypothetical protein